MKLRRIPVLGVGPDFPIRIARRLGDRGYELHREAIGNVPEAALRALDRLARAWLERHHSPYAAEIAELAAASRAPGLYFLNVSYEWGCTTAAKPDPSGDGVVLQRTLDWKVNGLGRHIVAARIACPLGQWTALTWPAFTGVIQAVAPGRFAAAINQPAPSRLTGVRAVDWLLSKAAIWPSPHLQPAHLLRRVFETAPDFATARDMLIRTPVAAPVIYTLAGIDQGESVTIERQDTEARLIEDAHAANEWRAADWRGRQHRAYENDARLAAIRGPAPAWDTAMPWLREPVLNVETRLAMLASASRRRLMAQGFEAGRPATLVLDLAL